MGSSKERNRAGSGETSFRHCTSIFYEQLRVSRLLGALPRARLIRELYREYRIKLFGKDEAFES